MFFISHFHHLGCWSIDTHQRPSFKEIQRELDKIVRSGFTQTPNESFHTMQNDWKKEIAEVLQELRIKEKVRSISWKCLCEWLCIGYPLKVNRIQILYELFFAVCKWNQLLIYIFILLILFTPLVPKMLTRDVIEYVLLYVLTSFRLSKR